MSRRSTVVVALGTRPEVIKLAPVVRALRALEIFDVRLIATAQHRQMLDQMLAHFELKADLDLDLMVPGQRLHEITGRILGAMTPVLGELKPDALIVQGDTTTTFASALAAFYLTIPVAHVEAGLRSHNLLSPFPEEMNRRATSLVTTWHFAPTTRARDNLLEEGLAPDSIYMVGNTVVDALLDELGRTRPAPSCLADPPAPGPLVLVTLHRRESFGEPMRRLAAGLRTLIERHRDAWVLLPIHPNPEVRKVLLAELDHPRVRIVPPLDYPDFCRSLARARLAVSDSGGVQEEAPTTGTPVLVARENTERPEAIESGTSILIGSDPDRLVDLGSKLLTDDAVHARHANVASPFGDGNSSGRIAEALERALRPAARRQD